jgi:hypothetical protein
MVFDSGCFELRSLRLRAQAVCAEARHRFSRLSAPDGLFADRPASARPLALPFRCHDNLFVRHARLLRSQVQVKIMNCSHELRYLSLFHRGPSLEFPCDAEGHVAMEALGERALENYLYARAMVGREFAFPSVNKCSVPLRPL